MKRNIIALLTVAMLSITTSGCTAKNQESGIEIPMSNGRYVEEEIILPVTIPGMSELTFSNGTPAFADCGNNVIYSMNDKKNSFTACSFKGINENYVIYEYTVSAQAEAWSIYELSDNYREGEPREMFIGHSGKEWQAFSLGTEYWFSAIEMTQNDRIFTLALEKAEPYRTFICEIDTQNKTMELLQEFSPDHANSLDIISEYIISVYGDEVYLYNYITEERLETPKVLEDFVKSEKFGESLDSDNESFDFCTGEDGTMYIACKSGLYRYVMGGNQIEQLVDGNACHLGNPSWRVMSVLQENENSFLVSFTNGKIMRYYYDKNAGNAYDTELRIFSLCNNETAMYTIYEYRSLYPNVDIIYQTAESDNYTDAMLELEALLASDTPPDVIITDGMEIEDLTGKHTLLPLSEYESTLFPDGDILKNIAQNNDDDWYTMPCRFSIPCVAGNSENLYDDYTELLSLTENIYRETEEGFVSYYDGKAETLLEVILPIAWDNWYDDGKVTESELTAFFEGCKSLHQTVIRKNGCYSLDISTLCGYHVWFENTAPFVANVNDIIDLMDLCALSDAEEEFSYRLEQSFIPSCCLSINASTKNLDNAICFLQTAVSNNVQSIESDDGLPVSKTVLSAYSQRNRLSISEYNDENYLGTGFVDNLTEEEIADYITTFITTAENMETAILIGGDFKGAVIEYGAKCMKGEIDAPSAAKAVIATME